MTELVELGLGVGKLVIEAVTLAVAVELATGVLVELLVGLLVALLVALAVVELVGLGSSVATSTVGTVVETGISVGIWVNSGVLTVGIGFETGSLVGVGTTSVEAAFTTLSWTIEFNFHTKGFGAINNTIKSLR